MSYVDGYVLPVPRPKLRAYVRLAAMAERIWREHGALDYKECVGDDLATRCGIAFPRAFKLKPREALIFSYVVFRSRAHRDRVNAKVMEDPRIKAMCNEKNMPFDPKRMTHGGFKVVVG